MNNHSPSVNARTVTLAVLTYQRTDDLVRCVDSMVAEATAKPIPGWEIAEILVVDNNPDGSASEVVAKLGDNNELLVRYTHEPTPGIVAARNRALDEATGDVLVFIDDDEVALPGWPAGLLQVMASTGAAMVGGPVVTEFIEKPPKWAVDSGFFDVDDAPDASERTWLSTCNVAIDLQKTNQHQLRFDARYPHGEDGTFSRLAASNGMDLRWSSNAKVKEFVSPERTTLAWRRNRQRISTNAWVRTDLDLDSSHRNKIMIVAKAVARLGQAVATTAIGAIRRDRATLYGGVIMFSHVRGSIEGLLTHRRSPS